MCSVTSWTDGFFSSHEILQAWSLGWRATDPPPALPLAASATSPHRPLSAQPRPVCSGVFLVQGRNIGTCTAEVFISERTVVQNKQGIYILEITSFLQKLQSHLPFEWIRPAKAQAQMVFQQSFAAGAIHRGSVPPADNARTVKGQSKPCKWNAVKCTSVQEGEWAEVSEVGPLVYRAGLASQARRCMKHTYSCVEFAALLHLLNRLFSQIALGCAIIFFENGIQLTLFHLTGRLLSEGKLIFWQPWSPASDMYSGCFLRTTALSSCQACPGVPAQHCAWQVGDIWANLPKN